ncbi:MAG: ECF-type sigma factor [Phycisphaerales bacterium]
MAAIPREIGGAVPEADATRGEVTRIIEAMGRGESARGAELLELVYVELRRMAGAAMARERHGGAGHTLQPTALVHEAYLRLMGDEGAGARFENRAHFFGAAGEAMRRILVDQARRRKALKRGGGAARQELPEVAAPEAGRRGAGESVDVMALNDALLRLEGEDARMATIVKLRFFAGMTVDETAAALDLSRRTVLREWISAKAWLLSELGGADETPRGRPGRDEDDG